MVLIQETFATQGGHDMPNHTATELDLVQTQAAVRRSVPQRLRDRGIIYTAGVTMIAFQISSTKWPSTEKDRGTS